MISLHQSQELRVVRQRGSRLRRWCSAPQWRGPDHRPEQRAFVPGRVTLFFPDPCRDELRQPTRSFKNYP